MKILIVCATKFELSNLTESLILKSTNHTDFKSYSYKELKIDILITGVGTINTSYLMGRILSQNDYDFAINTGICGSYNRTYQLGECVVVKSECFPEIGVEDGNKFIPLPITSFAENKNIVSKHNEIINHSPLLKKIKVLKNYKNVKGATVNTVSGNENRISEILIRYSPEIESMEGAAFMHACLFKDMECLEFRSISNYVEKRNKKNWEIDLAIDNLNSNLLLILDNLNEISIEKNK